MSEFYIVANSFAAPFFSDMDTAFVKAASAKAALIKYAKTYDHPAGLYCANCYRDANASAKGAKPLAEWQSNHLIALLKETKDKPGYSYFGHAPGDFEVNDKRIKVKNPKAGKVVS